MKITHKNFSIEINDDGDIVIGKDGQKYMTLTDAGTLQVQGETGNWGGVSSAKLTLEDSLQSFGSGLFELYFRGSKIVLVSKDSNQDPVWLYFDFDAPGNGWQIVKEEP